MQAGRKGILKKRASVARHFLEVSVKVRLGGSAAGGKLYPEVLQKIIAKLTALYISRVSKSNPLSHILSSP